MIPLGPVVARGRVRATRQTVWSHLTDAAYRDQWWPGMRFDPRIGGELVRQRGEDERDANVPPDASGEIDVLVTGHAIGFRWREHGDEYSTTVLITLRSQGEETGITVTETGFDPLPDAAERAATSQEGWRVLLSDFAQAVESGSGFSTPVEV